MSTMQKGAILKKCLNIFVPHWNNLRSKNYWNRRTGFQNLWLKFKGTSVVQYETASTPSNSPFKKPVIIWILQNAAVAVLES